jgi:Plasmid pRiA4b ORF-3-like protein
MMASMRKPTPDRSPEICHVSITLDEVVPKVSRMVAVPLGIRLDRLHLVIQAAMGWTNSHLWLFQARRLTWGVPDPDYPDDTIPASRTLLLDMVADIGTNRFTYVYDFGDHWGHTIKLVKPMPAAPGVEYPLLLDAVGRCPLEDCGGSDGYMELLSALRDPAHARHAEVIAWPGADFDPTDPNRAKLEQDVAGLAKLMTPRQRSLPKAKPSTRPRNAESDEWF